MRSRSGCIAAAALLVGGVVARGAETIQLSVVVDSAGSTYKVYETVSPDDGGTLGVFSTDIQVMGSGGITLNPSTDPATLNDLPTGMVQIGARKTEQAGFFNFNLQTDVAPNELEFSGGQGVTYDFNSTNQHGNIVTGFGIHGVPSGAVGDGSATWGDPALVAEGKYSGTKGMIQAIGVPTTPSSTNPGGTNTLLLPAVLPTTSGSPVGPAFATEVDPGTANIGSSLLPGDVNGDGVVNFSDLVILAAHYGLTKGATWEVGDFNADGGVGFDDLVILAAHYGDHAGAAEVAVVPEPSSIALAALAPASLLLRRRR